MWPSNTHGYISEKNGNTNSKRYMQLNVHSSIVYNCQDMEPTLVFINRWVDEEGVLCIYIYTHIYIYIHNGIVLSHKKE